MNWCWLQYNYKSFSSILFDLHSTAAVSQEHVLLLHWLCVLIGTDAGARQALEQVTTVPFQHYQHTMA